MLMEIRSRKFPRERMREITVKYKEDGIEKEKIDVIKDIVKNEDGTYNIIFAGDIKRI